MEPEGKENFLMGALVAIILVHILYTSEGEGFGFRVRYMDP
jgi:hypothetical protein